MTETEPVEQTDVDTAPRGRQELALAPSRLPMSRAIAKEFEIDPTQWRVLVEQTFPSAKTIEAVLMALSYCRARNLDIFKKPVHIVPMWSSELGRMVETVWPGIAEIRTTAARTGEYAGIDEVVFGPMIDRKFSGTIGRKNELVTKTIKFPEWASVVVYRIVKGTKCAFHSKVFWEETYASIGKSDVPNDMWSKRSRGQLDKCVEAAGLRKAFPEEVGSMYAAEEMEGRVIDAAPADITPSRPTPPTPPAEDTDPTSTDQPSGGSIPPGVPAANPMSDSPKHIVVDDSDTDDYSDLITAPPPMPRESYFLRIEEELSELTTEDEVIQHYETLGVDIALAGNDKALDRAAAIRNRHLARVNGQGDLLAEREFPGDIPLTRAQKLAGTP